MPYGTPACSDLRLARVPAMHHPHGAQRPVYPTSEGGYPRLVSESRGPEYEPRRGQPLTRPLGTVPQVGPPVSLRSVFFLSRNVVTRCASWRAPPSPMVVLAGLRSVESGVTIARCPPLHPCTQAMDIGFFLVG